MSDNALVCGEFALRHGFAIADCVGKSDLSDSILHLNFFGRAEMLPEFYSFVQTRVGFTIRER